MAKLVDEPGVYVSRAWEVVWREVVWWEVAVGRAGAVGEGLRVGVGLVRVVEGVALVEVEVEVDVVEAAEVEGDVVEGAEVEADVVEAEVAGDAVAAGDADKLIPHARF